jgi:hypothetical protein
MGFSWRAQRLTLAWPHSASIVTAARRMYELLSSGRPSTVSSQYAFFGVFSTSCRTTTVDDVFVSCCSSSVTSRDVLGPAQRLYRKLCLHFSPPLPYLV